MSRNSVPMRSELQQGDVLLSNNQQYKAVFQEDGNFVVYHWKPIWHTDSANKKGTRLIMQEDCNLVMYREGNVTPCNCVWNTGTYFPDANRCRLTLRDDGNLVVENDGREVWKSSKNK